VLVVTPDAAQAVDAIVSQPELPDSAGLRITAIPQADNSGAPKSELRLDLVEAPEPEDAVIEGSSVYLEPATAELLEDKLLDAELEENKVQFSIRQQAEPPGPVGPEA
jgi:iron-sulfur cluster assembly protein